MIALGVADDGLDGRAAAQLALDRLADAAPLACDEDFELRLGRGVVAAIAAVGDDAGEARSDLRLDLGQDGRKRMAIPRVKPEGRLQGLPGIAFTWAMNWPPFER